MIMPNSLFITLYWGGKERKRERIASIPCPLLVLDLCIEVGPEEKLEGYIFNGKHVLYITPSQGEYREGI